MKYDLELITDELNALSIMLKQIQTHSLILEFGPANGRMTKYLKEVLKCDVYIVELDKEAAKDAMKYAVDGLIGDIEQYEWIDKWNGTEFDYIIFADVLEHLRNPQAVLSKSKRLLKNNGKTIISVPNIAHNSVLINLYKNKFEYTSLGLLDNTHIHFFAYNTLKDFCHYAGYIPVVEDAAYSNVGENEILCGFDDVDRDIAYNLKKREYGSVYQYVFTLQKEEYVKWNEYNADYRIKKNMPIGEFKIYLDRGSGFCEDNSISYHSYLNDRFIKEIVLENCEEIRAIRIDPLNISGIFKFTKIQTLDQEGEKNWTINECVCNGKNIAGYLFFDHDDPQVIIENTKFRGYAKLIIEIEYVCVSGEENVIKTCIDIMEKNVEESKRELLKYEDKIEERRLLDEELNKCYEELEHRMDEINRRDQAIDKQRNEIALLKEELSRRAVELEHRMDEINHRDQEISRQANEINRKDQEIGQQANENVLLREELNRRAVELDHRMEEINLRDRRLNKQENELKLMCVELERRSEELDHRMNVINKQSSDIEEREKEKIDLEKENKMQEEVIKNFQAMNFLRFIQYKLSKR